MKRFIDLRGQIDDGPCFAWFDTVFDRFEEHSGEHVWTSWAEFENDFEGDDLTRYRRLCPAWVAA